MRPTSDGGQIMRPEAPSPPCAEWPWRSRRAYRGFSPSLPRISRLYLADSSPISRRDLVEISPSWAQESPPPYGVCRVAVERLSPWHTYRGRSLQAMAYYLLWRVCAIMKWRSSGERTPGAGVCDACAAWCGHPPIATLAHRHASPRVRATQIALHCCAYAPQGPIAICGH